MSWVLTSLETTSNYLWEWECAGPWEVPGSVCSSVVHLIGGLGKFSLCQAFIFIYLVHLCHLSVPICNMGLLACVLPLPLLSDAAEKPLGRQLLSLEESFKLGWAKLQNIIQWIWNALNTETVSITIIIWNECLLCFTKCCIIMTTPKYLYIQ